MKNKIIKNTFLLLVCSLITKVLSIFIKIIISRNLSTEILGLYMMIIPTMLLVMNLSNMGMPLAISKLIADKNINNKKLMFSIFLPIAIVNILLMILVFSFSKVLALSLLHNSNLYLAVVSISLVIPFSTMSSVIKSYFIGKGKVTPIVIGSVIESFVKVIVYSYYLPIIRDRPISYILVFLIISNVICEVFDIFIMMIFVPKDIDFRKRDLIPNPYYLKTSLSIAIPNTTCSLIHSISHFLEPILITYFLSLASYSNHYINYNYGVITGYILPLISIPMFIISSITNSLLPSISKDYSTDNYRSIKRKVRLFVFISLLISLGSTIVLVSFPEIILDTLYKTTSGVNYLRILAPISIISYISVPLSSTLEICGGSKEVLKASIITCSLKAVSFIFFSFFRIGFYSFILAYLIETIVDFILFYFFLEKKLNYS